jgi:cobalamin biosynthesis Mg chelatase CobN
MRSSRSRRLAPAVAALLLTLFTVGLLADTGSARVGRLVAAVTTTPAEGITAEDTTTAVATSEATTTEATTEDTSGGITTVETSPPTTTIEVTTPGTTTATSISPGGAAVVGAAAATKQDESETPWGWIAFGILAAAVVIFAIVWLVRRPRRA